MNINNEISQPNFSVQNLTVRSTNKINNIIIPVPNVNQYVNRGCQRVIAATTECQVFSECDVTVTSALDVLTFSVYMILVVRAYISEVSVRS